jgi:hypothetical protein
LTSDYTDLAAKHPNPNPRNPTPFLLVDRRQGSDRRGLNSRGSGGSAPRRTRSQMYYDDIEKEWVAEPPSLDGKIGGDKTRKRFKSSKPKRFEFQDEKMFGHGASFFPGLDRYRANQKKIEIPQHSTPEPRPYNGPALDPRP